MFSVDPAEHREDNDREVDTIILKPGKEIEENVKTCLLCLKFLLTPVLFHIITQICQILCSCCST